MENQNFRKMEVVFEHDLQEGNKTHAALLLLHDFEKNPHEALALVKKELERNAAAPSSDKLQLVVQPNGDVMVCNYGGNNGDYAGTVPIGLRDQVLAPQQKPVELPPVAAPDQMPAQVDPQKQGPHHKGFRIHIPFPIDVGVRHGSFHIGLNLLGVAKGGIELGQKTGAYVGSDSLNTEVSAGVDISKQHIGPVVDWKVLGDTITTGQARVGITPGKDGAVISGGVNAYAFGKIVGVGGSGGVEVGKKVGPKADAFGYLGPAAVAADGYANISKNGLRAGANGEVTAEPYAGLYASTRVGLGKTNEAHADLGANVFDNGAAAGAGFYPQFHQGVYARAYSGSNEVGVDTTEQKDKAPEDRSHTFPSFLNSNYDGPVLVATIDGTLIDTSDTSRSRGNNGEPIFGAPGLLSQVEAQCIPIIYLSTNASAIAGLPSGTLVTPDQLPALRKQLPHAQFFGLGNDAGSDATFFGQNGVRTYLLNTEATQKNVPAGFQGILSDNFTPRFTERLLSDLQAAKTHQPLSPPSNWVAPPPIPPNASLSGRLKTGLEFVAGTPLYIASNTIGDLVHPVEKPATPAPGDWAGFEKFMDQGTKTVARLGSRVEPLIDGEKAFNAMFDAIDGAKSSVNYTVFQFASDETGWEMARHLAAAADRGCAVRLVYDQTGSALSNGSPTDPGIFAFLRKHGVEVHEQHTRTLHITHRKLMVVDGSTGFIGGMNCADEYHETWHDVYSRVSGPAVADLQGLFKAQWERDGGTHMPDSPPPAPIAGAGSARVVSHDGHRDEFLKQSYLAAIDTAEHTIRIADPYFSDSDVASQIEAAARRGVQVQLVFPHTNDDATLQHVERTMYPALLAAGVEVYEYYGRPMAHEKIASFDGRVSTIGSSNLDDLSIIFNDEANIWSMDPKTAQIMDQDVFAADLRQSTRIKSFIPTLQDKPARLRRLMK